MVDLSTKYLGINLRTPLVASASPLSQELDGIRRLEDAGASAIVLYSLFEEQLRQESFELDRHLEEGTDSFSEAGGEARCIDPHHREFKLHHRGWMDAICEAYRAGRRRCSRM